MKFFFVAAALIASTAFADAHPAKSFRPGPGQDIMLCRDCGFPMRIGEGRWMMPNEKVVVEIERHRLPSRFEEVHVKLVDSFTGETIAEGIAKQKRGRKTINVQMQDAQGNPIKGYVHFVSLEKEKIGVRFECENCLISDLID